MNSLPGGNIVVLSKLSVFRSSATAEKQSSSPKGREDRNREDEEQKQMSCRGPEVRTQITKINIQLCVGVMMETFSVDIAETHTKGFWFGQELSCTVYAPGRFYPDL